MPVTDLLLHVAAFAALNRLSGMDEWFPGRNIYATTLLAGIFGWVVVGPLWGFFLTVTMMAYRLPGWFGLNGLTTWKGAGLMMLRHLFLAPIFIHAAAMGYSSWVQAALLLITTSITAGFIYLAYNSFRIAYGNRHEWVKEVAVGAAIGLGIGGLL